MAQERDCMPEHMIQQPEGLNQFEEDKESVKDWLDIEQ